MLKKLVLLFIIVILGFISVWIFVKYQSAQKELSPTQISTSTSQVPIIPVSTPTNLEEILGSDKEIRSSQTAPNGVHVFAEVSKSLPIAYFLTEDKNGPHIMVMDDLVFLDLVNKEKRKFDLYDLASTEIINPLRSIPVEVQFIFYVSLLKWSHDSNDFWGAVYLLSGADPPVNDSVSLFKINRQNWAIEKFALPERFINSLRDQNFNLEKNAVLFESVENDELVLYVYELTIKKKTILVSYDNSVFSKYLPGKYGFVGYFHPWFLETEDRRLNAKWLDSNTVSYVDFVTRQEIVKKVE